MRMFKHVNVFVSFWLLELCMHLWKFLNEQLLVIIKYQGVRSMISIPGSLSFAKLVVMSSVPAKSATGDARYAS